MGIDKQMLKKIWYFIWDDNSIWSWIVNIVLAFVLIKFIVYPGLGFLLSTSHPIVAVVSSSMEHEGDFEYWWRQSDDWYISHGISKETFLEFSLKNGFNKGDIMVLKGKKAAEIMLGDIIVFQSNRPDPIIHRVVKKWEEDGSYLFQTKGDNFKTNPTSIKAPELDETRITEGQVIGKALIRVPYLGYVKIWFTDLLKLVIG